MSLYIYVGETGFIFMVTGYSLDHVEHVIKQIFVMFNTNIQLGWFSVHTTNQTPH
jgi:hypothetical protein